MGICLADQPPAFCSACHNSSPEMRHVDFDAAHDAGAFADVQAAYVASQDELVICEACMRVGLEHLELKPELHARQREEIRRLSLELDYWRDAAKRGLKSLNENFESRLGTKRRKAAA